ncbi:hypothetical protein R3I93_012749 [Phoxinus phoxinus]|uniref:Uncharacterized protein n=1 Tax=Phoxinus phoxinus TaxID=58324 RepID=A0AAN9CVC6_9TELE
MRTALQSFRRALQTTWCYFLQKKHSLPCCYEMDLWPISQCTPAACASECSPHSVPQQEVTEQQQSTHQKQRGREGSEGRSVMLNELPGEGGGITTQVAL